MLRQAWPARELRLNLLDALNFGVWGFVQKLTSEFCTQLDQENWPVLFVLRAHHDALQLVARHIRWQKQIQSQRHVVLAVEVIDAELQFVCNSFRDQAD